MNTAHIDMLASVQAYCEYIGQAPRECELSAEEYRYFTVRLAHYRRLYRRAA